MRALTAILVVALGAVAACNDDAAEPPPAEPVEAGVYVAIVTWFVEAEPDPEDDEPRPVFLDDLDGQAIPIDVQVGMVQRLEDDEEMSVRFIDATNEAIDRSLEGEPVRSGGLLLRLGPVVHREDHVEVDVEQYESDEATTRYRIHVVSRADQWRVDGEPEEVPVPEAAS